MRILIACCVLAAAGRILAADYAVVVSEKTWSDPKWRQVAEVLQERHRAAVIRFTNKVEEAGDALRALFPRRACFVAQPEEAGRAFVSSVHRLTRRLDTDPYTDCFWGILTGYDAAAALRIAQCREPLTVRKVAAGTEVALEMCEEGLCYDELVKNKLVKKVKGEQAILTQGPDDTTGALADTLNTYRADLFVASGHATERDWQIGYSYRNGTFRCAGGRLYGLDTKGTKIPIESANPKVYLPIGNCLMGHVDGKDAMALAWMNSAGVNQMIGYTVVTWYGYAGWGCLDYFVEQPGRYTFCEAFFANSHALIHRLQQASPGAETAEAEGRASGKRELSDWARAEKLTGNDIRGLMYDCDTVAFYGDPAWEARMATGSLAWRQSLVEKDGTWTFTLQPNRGAKTFDPINKNGSQRGYRPIVEYLPKRIRNARVVEGADLSPVIADDFILVPNPKQCDSARQYKIVFKADPW